MDKLFNKELESAGSSGSVDAAPRMTEKCGHSTPSLSSSGLSRGSILPLKNKGRLRGVFDLFKTHPTFPYALREGQIGRSTPSLSLRGGFANEAISCRLPRPVGLAMTGYKKCGLAMMEQRGHSTPARHPWTSVSEIRGSKEGNCPVGNLIWGAMRHNESKWKMQDELMSELKSTGRGFGAPHPTRFAQYGRSMVEMLGVLAVMGILSIVGIAGYTHILDKHHANTLINQILINHISLYASPNKQNNTWQNIQSDLYTMQFRYDKSGNDYIKIKNIPSGVCKQLTNMNTLLFYTTDHEKFDLCTETNEIIVGFNSNVILPNPDSLDTGSCDNGNVYLSYKEEHCLTAQDMIGDCKKNSDCEKGKWCKIFGKWTGTDAIITEGKCTLMDEGEDITYNNQNFLIKKTYMTYWAAENWCKAHKKQLIDVSDLDCIFGVDCPETDDFGTNKFYWINYPISSPYARLINFSPQKISANSRSSGMYAICK